VQRVAGKTDEAGNHGSGAGKALSRLAGLAFALACAAQPARGLPPTQLTTSHVPPASEAKQEPVVEGPASLSATLIGQVSEGTFGPYLGAARDGRALALWAAADEQGKRHWFAVSFDAKGTPLERPHALGDAPTDLALARVVPSHDGFVALFTRAQSSGTRVEALSLSDRGALLAGPTLLEEAPGEVAWIEALGGGTAPIAAWASVREGSAELRAAAIDFKGQPRPAPLRVVGGAKAWQAVEFSDGVALAAVVPGTGPGSDSLRVFFLGSDASLIGQSEVVSGKRLSPEIDAARAGEKLLVAWVEQDGDEQRLAAAALGADTKRAAAPVQLPALGSQRLYGFVSSGERSDDALLVWEDLGQAPRGQRRFRIARISGEAKLDARRAELIFVGEARDRPEFARKGSGLAMLTRALPCPREGQCNAQEPVPTYVELSADFALLASEPLRIEPAAGQTPDLAWGLHCGADVCSALGALPAAPVPLYAVELRPRSRSWDPPVRALSSEAPRARSMRNVAETDPLADVAAAPVADGWLVASLTQFDESTPYVKRTTPAPDGRMGPLRALLAVRPLARGQKSPGAMQVISYRARAPGGLALAGSSDGRALLLWTALDKMRPEVFATLIPRTGKMQQRMLTQAAGQVTALAAAVLPQGFMAAWISDPQGQAQVFTARLGADLTPAAPPAPLAVGQGPAVAVQLLRRGDSAWIAWVQSSDNVQRLLLARLDPKNGARLGEARVVQHTEAGTLSSPVLAAQGNGALLAWIEHPVVGGGGGRAWAVEIDAEARVHGEPRQIRSSSGDAVAVRIACEGSRCFGSLDCRPPKGALLEGFTWPNGAAPGKDAAAKDAAAKDAAAKDAEAPQEPPAEELIWRASAASDAPAFAIAGGQIFYGDRRQQRGLFRRLDVEWQ
jgi:hypothetical protein